MHGYIGQIRTFGFNFAPTGTAFCNGQILQIAQNETLFALIGTTYGGDGVQTYALPNLQSRAPIHIGAGGGLSNYVIGQQGGNENVTLLSTQMPAHTHPFADSGSSLSVSQTKGTVAKPAAGASAAQVFDANTTTGNAIFQIYVPAGTGTQVALGGLNVAGTNAIAGGSQSHPNVQPYLALNFCIMLQGIFPTRN